MRVSRQVATSSALGLALSCASLLPAAAQTATQTAVPVARPSQQLPAISVEGAKPQADYKVDRASSPKMSEPLLDTPQTITIIPREVIEDRGANSLRDVLRTVPGVTISAGEGGGPQGDNLKIRGFAANTDLFIDGMRDQGQYSRDSFNLEQVEVVKGGSATSAGRGATGGAVNLVTKAPVKEAITAGTVAMGTDRTKRVTVDLNQPLTAMGLDNTAVRLNVMGHTSGIAGRDVVENNRWAFAPSVTFGVTGPTKLTLSYFHIQEDNMPDYGIPVINATSLPNVKRENYYGFKDLNAENTRVDIGTARFEHEFNDTVTVRNTLRASQTRRQSNVSVPRAANVLTNSMTKVPTARDATLKALDNQTDVTLKFATGALKHTVVTGMELAAERYHNQPYTFSANASTTDRLFTPNPFALYTGTRTTGAKTETDSNTVAFYLMDTIKIGEQWEIAGGLRYDRFNAETKIPSTAGRFERTDNLVSWRGALIYKPVPNASVYVSASTSYNPSAEGLALSATTADTPPEKNMTYEVGAKWDVLADTLSLTGAVFRTEKTDARETLPGGTIQVLNGVRRVDGIELGVAGHVTSKWQVFGGYTYQTSEIVETFTAANKGNELASTPKHTFSLWTTYELPWNLKVGGGVQVVADRYWSDANLGKIPNYAVFDAMAAYTIRPGIDLQLNVYNLTDKFYIERVHAGGGHAVPGAGRTAMLTTNVKF
ncbi:TonB-dependent receptor [Azospirillum doebereinerae]